MSEHDISAGSADGDRGACRAESSRGAQRVQRAPDCRDDGLGGAGGARSRAARGGAQRRRARRSAPAPTWRGCRRWPGTRQEENIRDATAAARMFSAIDRLPVPVIARIHGAAIGGGAGLAAVADIAVASSDATFGFTEVKLGLAPAIIAPYVLAKIGRSAARELFITGRRFNAEEARQIGLVHAVVAAKTGWTRGGEISGGDCRRRTGGDRCIEGADPPDRQLLAGRSARGSAWLPSPSAASLRRRRRGWQRF